MSTIPLAEPALLVSFGNSVCNGAHLSVGETCDSLATFALLAAMGKQF